MIRAPAKFLFLFLFDKTNLDEVHAHCFSFWNSNQTVSSSSRADNLIHRMNCRQGFDSWNLNWISFLTECVKFDWMLTLRRQKIGIKSMRTDESRALTWTTSTFTHQNHQTINKQSTFSRSNWNENHQILIVSLSKFIIEHEYLLDSYQNGYVNVNDFWQITWIRIQFWTFRFCLNRI